MKRGAPKKKVSKSGAAIAKREKATIAKGPEKAEADIEASKDPEEIRAITAASKAAAKYVEERKEGVGEINRWLKAVLRGQRKFGRFLIEAAPHGGDRRSSAHKDHLKALARLKVSRTESKRCRDLAKIDEATFEGHLKAACEKGERLTTSGTIAATSEKPDYDSDQWFTPARHVELVREVLGEIELDPASCEKAQATVQAERFFAEEDKPLGREWTGKTFLNPPYSDPAPWVRKLLEAHREGDVEAAIVLVNNSTDTQWGQELLAASARVCFTEGRLAFVHGEDGSETTGGKWGQMFCYLGPDPRTFEDVFADVGVIVVPNEAASPVERDVTQQNGGAEWFEDEASA